MLGTGPLLLVFVNQSGFKVTSVTTAATRTCIAFFKLTFLLGGVQRDVF